MESFLIILTLLSLAGMVIFFVLALVKGKGNRRWNIAKSGGCLIALIVVSLIGGSIIEDAPAVASSEAEATAAKEEETQGTKEQAQKEKEEQEAKEAEEQAQKEKEEQEAKEVEEQAQKEKEEQEASVSVSQEHAVIAAKSYVNYTAFSKRD